MQNYKINVPAQFLPQWFCDNSCLCAFHVWLENASKNESKECSVKRG